MKARVKLAIRVEDTSRPTSAEEVESGRVASRVSRCPTSLTWHVMNLPDASSGGLIVLLDMDGTLTRPVMDFEQMRREMGLPAGKPILEVLDSLDARHREHALAVLHRHERYAAAVSELNDGCRELLAALAEAGARCALVTRNSPQSVETVLQRHGLRFPVVVTRDDLPFKPHPACVFLALRRLGFDLTAGGRVWLQRTWMVGDGAHDIEAGRAAGVRTVWLSHGQVRSFDAVPDHEAADLFEVRRILLDGR